MKNGCVTMCERKWEGEEKLNFECENKMNITDSISEQSIFSGA